MDEIVDSLADGALATPSVIVTNEEAVALAKAQFGLDGAVVRFATEKDDTFRLTVADGRRFTLKVANRAENPREIAFQLDLLRHIAATSPSLPVPRVVPDRDGRLQSSYLDSQGQRRQAYLLTYLDGVPLSEVDADAAQREKVGEMLATLRLAMAGYRHEMDGREVAWDVKHLLKLEPLLSEIGDGDKRALLSAGLERFARILDRLQHCRSQVLHNDFSKSNVVVDPSQRAFVTGVIDFGDAVRTAIAIDVSTALLNQLPAQPVDSFFGDGFDVLRGYLRIADLTTEELSLIPHLVTGRIVARVLLTTWRGRLFPNNAPYILRNTEQSWFQLRWFMSRSIDDLSSHFIAAARR